MFTAKAEFRGLRRIEAGLLQELPKLVNRAGNAAVQDAQGTARFQDHTGQLRHEIHTEGLRYSARKVEVMVRAGAPYAWFVEKPTKPHWIYPKAGYNTPKSRLMPGQTRRGRGKGPHESVVGRGRALRWKDEAGNEIFARRVWHPGTRGTLFMSHACAVGGRTLFFDILRLIRNLARGR